MIPLMVDNTIVTAALQTPIALGADIILLSITKFLAGNATVIVDETADLADAAEKIRASKTFDNATSCSSENALVVVEAMKMEIAIEADEAGVVREVLCAQGSPVKAGQALVILEFED